MRTIPRSDVSLRLLGCHSDRLDRNVHAKAYASNPTIAGGVAPALVLETSGTSAGPEAIDQFEMRVDEVLRA